MIHCQRDVCPAAVLAPMGIPAEDIFARENDLLERNPDVHRQADDAREGHPHGHRADLLPVMRFDELRLAEVEKDDRLLCIDHAHRLVVLIENQNFRVELPVAAVCLDLCAEVSFTSLLSAWVNESPS